MEKIIAAFDGLQYSESTRDYAVDVAKKSASHLVGVFLDDPSYTSYKIYDLVATEGVSEDKLNKFEQKDTSARAAASAAARSCVLTMTMRPMSTAKDAIAHRAMRITIE